MQRFLKLARGLGFSEAVLLEDLSLGSKPELRAYCDACPNKGKNWVCPPACGALERCQERVQEFSKGILLQSVTNLTPPTAPEVYGELSRAHSLRFRDFVEAVKPELSKLLPLATGGCVLCDACSYPEPCVHPEIKMESLSAFGIDVGDLCRAAGLPYSFREDRVYFTALLLFM